MDLMIILRAMTSVLIKRRKKVSLQILLAFLKRVAMLGTQVLHNGALGCLGIIKTVMQVKTTICIDEKLLHYNIETL